MTTRQQYERLAEILAAAYELPPEEQPQLLDRECGGDRSLRAEVEALLAEDVEPESFLDSPALGEDFSLDVGTVELDSGKTWIGTQIGHYRLTRVIATGGMGTVFEATQDNPPRTVAAKVMRYGVASRSALRRFEHEAQILARLHHPGIAEIHEAGTHDPGTGGVPYFIMEYVQGARSLTDYAGEKQLDIRTRLELFMKACRAVHHGHQKGIIHRDLKPANILVDAEGQLKIIDFGVARATDADVALTAQTHVGELLGTLQYMSPEQCKADANDVDTRSDIYSLGVVLYELLCERPPYDVAHVPVPEAARVIRESKPPRPSGICRVLRGDLETIVLKALAKDRQRRYQSAAEFAQDIERYLTGEAILARPPSLAYQFRVFVRRNRAVSAAVAALLLVLVAGATVSTSRYLGERDARKLAQERQAVSDAVTEFLTTILASIDPVHGQGVDLTVLDALGYAAETVATAFPDQPLVEAAVRMAIGETYAGLKHFSRARPQLEAAVEIRRRVLGEDDPRTIESMMHLALALYELKPSEGRALAVRTVELSRLEWGEADPNTLHTRIQLRCPTIPRDDRGERERQLRVLVDVCRRVLGDDHPDTLLAKHQLASHVQFSRRHAEALVMFEELLEARRRVLGDDHPDTLESMREIAWHLQSSAVDLPRAEQLFRESLATRQRLRGRESMDATWAMLGLGFVLGGQGRPEEAEPHMRQAVEIRQKILPPGHIDLAQAKKHLGNVLVLLGGFEEAERLLLESYPVIKARYKWSGQLIDAVQSIAELYERWGKREKAAEWRTRLVETKAEFESSAASSR